MIPVLLQDVLPGAGLQEYIRRYQIFRFVFDKETTPPVKFHAPRPEHCITFYLRDPQKFSYTDSPAIFTYPICVINGMYTIPLYRYGGNDFWAIKCVLQPSAFFKLTGMSLVALTNSFINAEDVWGNEIRSVCDQLLALDDLGKMLTIIESFFIRLINKSAVVSRPIDITSCYLLQIEKTLSLNWLASQSCLSIRQFIRKFEERVGISAKTFERIVRFDRAFRLKNSHPAADWLYIALACGYHDYQHMVKDFKEFTHFAPPAFYEVEKKSPERSFGLYEG